MSFITDIFKTAIGLSSKQYVTNQQIDNLFKASKQGDIRVGLNHKTTILQNDRSTKDIKDWKRAIIAAENIERPNRIPLYNNYHNLLLDGFLLSIINKRKINISNSELVFYTTNGKKDKKNDINQDIIQTPFFRDTLNYIMDSIFWGHSLIEFVVNDGKIVYSELINRFHVRPEFHEVCFDAYNVEEDKNKIRYDKPPYNNYVMPVGTERDLGLLMAAAPYVIYKRSALANWAQYAELFGHPFRKGKYKSFDDQTRITLEKALEAMGSAAWAVIPEEAELDIIPIAGSQGSSDLYNMLRQACNEELSILVLGQTMTTSDGSSRSQAEVHLQVEDKITMSDKIWVEHILNWRFKKILSAHGYNVDGGKFAFADTNQLTKPEHLKILIDINNNFGTIDPDYIAKTFDVPITKNNTIDENKKKNTPIDKQLLTMLDVHKNEKPSIQNTLKQDDNDNNEQEISQKIDTQFMQLARLAYENKTKKQKNTLYTPLFKKIANYLFTSVTQNYSIDNQQYTDNTLIAFVRSNIFAFSAAKTLTEFKELSQLLIDSDNEFTTFNEFYKQATEINKLHNQQYLQTEHSYAIAASQMAAQWQNMQKIKQELPYLKYLTVGDDRVRDTHKDLDGITLHIDDPFWDKYYPPNGWGCRCDVVQISKTDAKDNGISDNKEAQKKAQKAFQNTHSMLFGKNTGKTGQWFDNKHPYFVSSLQNPYQLQAQENYGMAEFDRYEKTTPPKPLNTKAEFNAFWDKMLKENPSNIPNQIQIQEMFGLSVNANNQTKSSLTQKKQTAETTYKYANRIKQVLQQPNEIWDTKPYKDNKNVLAYLKQYSDTAVAVLVNPSSLTILNVQTVDKESALQLRTGILIQR